MPCGLHAPSRALSFCLARRICVFTVPTGQPSTSRGFLVRQVIMIALHDRRALRLGKQPHRAFQIDAQRRLPRHARRRGGIRHRHRLAVGVLGHRQLLDLSRVGQKNVVGDPIQPGRELWLPAETTSDCGKRARKSPEPGRRLARCCRRSTCAASSAPRTGAAAPVRRKRGDRPGRLRGRSAARR